MSGEEERNGWSENRIWIKKELDRHEKKLDGICSQIIGIREDIVSLKMKAGIWGLLGGLIPILITVLILILKNIL